MNKYTKTAIIVHHTASPYSRNPDQFKATDSYHKAKFGLKSSLGFYVGYTYEIAKDGTVYQARNENEETAAVREQSMNFHGISICLDGEFDKSELPTDEQCAALYKLIREVQQRWKITDENVFPHRHFAVDPKTGKPYKMCWGARLPENIISYLQSRMEPTKPLEKWQQDAISFVQTAGLSDGKDPLHLCTRVEMFEFMRKLYAKIDKDFGNPQPMRIVADSSNSTMK